MTVKSIAVVGTVVFVIALATATTRSAYTAMSKRGDQSVLRYDHRSVTGTVQDRLGTLSSEDIKADVNRITSIDVDIANKRMLTTCSGPYLYLWDVDKGKLSVAIRSTGAIYVNARFSESGNELCAIDAKALKIEFWKYETHTSTYSFINSIALGRHFEFVGSTAISSNLGEMAIAYGDEGVKLIKETRDRLLLVRPKSRKIYRQLDEFSDKLFRAPVRILACTRDLRGMIVRLGTPSPEYCRITARRSESYSIETLPVKEVMASCLLDNNKVAYLVAKKTRGDRARLYRWSDGEISFVGEPRGDVRVMASSPMGELLVTGAEDGGLEFTHLSQRKRDESVSEHEAAICALAFSSDGKWLFSGDVTGLVVRRKTQVLGSH